MEKLILAVYFNKDEMPPAQMNGALNLYKNILVDKKCDDEVILLPVVTEGETRVECVNPAYVSSEIYEELAGKANALLSEILEAVDNE